MTKKLPSTSSCPLCKKPSKPEFFPFCSKMCEYVDLGVWLRGEYVVPGALDEEAPSEPESEED